MTGIKVGTKKNTTGTLMILKYITKMYFKRKVNFKAWNGNFLPLFLRVKGEKGIQCQRGSLHLKSASPLRYSKRATWYRDHTTSWKTIILNQYLHFCAFLNQKKKKMDRLWTMRWVLQHKCDLLLRVYLHSWWEKYEKGNETKILPLARGRTIWHVSLYHPSIVRPTKTTFVIKPVEGRCALFAAIIT